MARPGLVLEQLPSYCAWNKLCSYFGLFWLWVLVLFGVFLVTWIFEPEKT